MTEERFKEIFEDESINSSWEGCNVTQGCLIIQKYMPKHGVEGAWKDTIYSVDIDQLVRAGIIEEDVIKLKKLNWMIEDNSYLACFV